MAADDKSPLSEIIGTDPNVNKYKYNEDVYEDPNLEWEDRETDADYYRDPIVKDPIEEVDPTFDPEYDNLEFE